MTNGDFQRRVTIRPIGAPFAPTNPEIVTLIGLLVLSPTTVIWTLWLRAASSSFPKAGTLPKSSIAQGNESPGCFPSAPRRFGFGPRGGADRLWP